MARVVLAVVLDRGRDQTLEQRVGRYRTRLELGMGLRGDVVGVLVAGQLDELDETGRWALLKLVTGAMRIGISARLAKTAAAALGAAGHDVRLLVRARLADEGARIALLNGSLEANLAADTAEQLRDAGFNVVWYGNADRFDYPETVIMAREGKDYTVSTLCDAFRVESEQVQYSSDLPPDTDIAVFLGRDYAQRASAE